MTMIGGGLGIAHLADIEPVAGRGSGTLFAATDLKLDRRVAVRLLEPLSSGAERGRFSHQSKVLGSLSSHPNVVTIYDAGFTEDDRPFLIMELIEGQDLGSYLAARGPLPWIEAAALATQISAGLEQAHRAGTLHGDLRPANVLMAGTVPKLVDFGISADPASRPSLETVASLHHRAPETLTGVWDERTDIYSLTSTLYQLLDGQPPFWRPADESVEALRLRLTHDRAPALSTESMPEAMTRFVAAGLAKDPIDRPQSADEFAHELQLITSGRTTGSSPSVLHGNTSTMAMAVPPPPVPSATTVSDGQVPAAIATAATVATSVPAQQVAGVAAGLAPPVAAPAGPGVMENWAPPTTPGAQPSPQWQPPTGGDGHTAVFTDLDVGAAPPQSFGGVVYDGQQLPPPGPGGDQPLYQNPVAAPYADPYDDGAAGGVGGITLLEEPADDPRRSPVFIAALVMIMIGIVGLAAVLALSALGSDDQAAAPALPNPDQPATVQAVDGETPADGEQTGSSLEDQAMADGSDDGGGTTTVVPDESSTTETTVARYQVPNLVGMPVEEAQKLLTDNQFQVVVVGRRSQSAAPGTVTGQVPTAGAQVTLPLTVTLYIPKVSNLPTMVGRQADSVCRELQALGLTCNRMPQYNDQVATGAVITTNPIEGSLFSEGSSVDVFLSLGPVPTVAVPDVTGLTEAEAEAQITAAGFTVVAKVQQQSAAVEAGRVIGSQPAAGATAPIDRPVTITISSGAGQPAKVTVPNVVGMTSDDAQTTLTGAGLAVTVANRELPADDPGIGMVLEMDPAAGSEVDPGATITITVGQQMTAPEENSEEG